jgi:translation initiation factor 5A
MDDYDFSSAEAGASETVPMEAGQIRKGGLIMIKGQPCKVADVSTSKTGKHGHAKCNFIAYNIFNNKKLEDMIPSTHGTTVPIVSKVEYTLIDISEDGYVTLMNENGETREDLQLPNYPENYAEELKEEFKNKQLIVTVLKACGNEQIISHKEENL